AIILLSVASIFPSPIQMQGFSADDIFNAEDVEPAETVMGVDGFFSAGFVPVPVPWEISLMPNSDSSTFFEQWQQAQKAAKQAFFASGSVTLISTGRQYIMSQGILSRFKAMPQAQKVLRARNFRITWGNVDSGPGPIV